ncbi:MULTISPECIES: hypothetical protein [Geobacter]|uniref:Uncharacterized protein n=2 Tax=Geobacter TaxID=28231 RepID=A0A0C1TP05_9BACT|nr:MULTISPECIES: hypothetical protein [Geobacter]ANA40530.1 hypothetical protein A2G06_09765 [Geobacter anodireducens]KIE42564.1 hypothetical protein SE37_07950 [Geobacter soli]MBE2887583.1 hypothetical protein [Geobacter anodireducens]HMN02564.1 hypothetical protein [Geobacter anodireducens]
MADAREVLEIMREVAKTRIAMLRDGTTFHQGDKRAYLLQQYEEKLAQIEHLIRRISIHIVGPDETDRPRPAK